MQWHSIGMNDVRSQTLMAEIYLRCLHAERDRQRFHSYKRGLFITAEGRMGLCDKHSQVGVEVPYAVRSAAGDEDEEGDNNGYLLVAEVYASEFMDRSLLIAKKRKTKRWKRR